MQVVWQQVPSGKYGDTGQIFSWPNIKQHKRAQTTYVRCQRAANQRFTAVLAKLREQDAQAKLTAPGGPSAMALDLPKAAKNLREVEALLEETDLHGVTVVDQEREWLATLGKRCAGRPGVDCIQYGSESEAGCM